MSFLPPLLASPKRLFCGARAVTWEPLLCASCSFLFSLLLSFSLVFLFPEYPSNTSPLPATGSSVPLCPSTRHQWDSWFFFLCLFLVPVSQQIFIHFACWKWGSGKIGSSTCSALTCWRRYLSLSQWSEVAAGLGIFLFPLGFSPFFLSHWLGLCYAGQTKNRSDGRAGCSGPSIVGI